MPAADALFCAALAGRPVTAARPDAMAAVAALARQNWQVQILVSDHLKGRRGDPTFRQEVMALRAFSALQLKALGEMCDALSGAGIPYALLKGSAARLFCHADPLVRTGWDMDVAVAPSDLAAAAEAVFALGYYPAQLVPGGGRFELADPDLRAAVEARHYELGFIIRRNRVNGLGATDRAAIEATLGSRPQWWRDAEGALNCYSSIDIHHGLSLDLPVGDLLAGARPLEWAGRTVFVPEPAWLALHLIYKIYWEGVHAYGKGLYQYADLLPLLARLDAGDIARLIDLIETHNLRAAAYFVLRRVPEAFGQPLAGDLEQHLMVWAQPEGDDPLCCNDLGDMWDKLWNRRGSRMGDA